ncbi:MAG: menE [Friedmanniella sp.]|nr:menE [Friedmanniella sp.]
MAPLPPDPDERARTLAMLDPAAPLREANVGAVVSTSGSTGRPKGVVLSRTALLTSAVATHTRLGGPGDWLLALPGHYVAGLMVVVRAVAAGTTLAPVRSDLTDLPQALGRLGPRRYLSLVPTQLARACRDPRIAAALGRVDTVLLGGAAADPDLLLRARDLGITVVTTYGMSETCGGVVYDGRPLDGVGVHLDDTGRIALSGPTLFSGYRGRPDLGAEVLRGGRLSTGDRGRWEAGRLTVLGRVDDVVVSGGLNVDLADVEQRLRGWPGWAGGEVAVVGVPDPEWGTAVVAVADRPVALADLRRWLSASGPAYAAPRSLHHLSALPRTSSGKIDRPALVALVQKGSA